MRLTVFRCCNGLRHGRNSQRQSNCPSKRSSSVRLLTTLEKGSTIQRREFTTTTYAGIGFSTHPAPAPAGKMVVFWCRKHSPCTLTWPTDHTRVASLLHSLSLSDGCGYNTAFLQPTLTASGACAALTEMIRTPCRPTRRAPRTPCREAASRPQTVQESVRSRSRCSLPLPQQRLFGSRTLSPPRQDSCLHYTVKEARAVAPKTPFGKSGTLHRYGSREESAIFQRELLTSGMCATKTKQRATTLEPGSGE